jgi:essential nuclear protein 1
MPKATTPVSAARQARRHNPLEEDLTAIGPLKNKPGKRKSRHQDEGEQFVDSKASRKILRIGQELADEDAEENQLQKPNTAFDFESRFDSDPEEETFEDGEAWGDEEEVEEIELAPDDLEAFNKFFPTEEDPLLRTGWGGEADETDEGPGTNLADLILEKIAAHEAAQAANGGNSNNAPVSVDEDFEIPAKVVEVYSKYDYPVPDNLQLLTKWQNWTDIITIQIRKIAKTV